MHVFTFPIHERDPAVVHLAVHLENGQRVYFTGLTALQQATTAPKTTLTEFFRQRHLRQDVVGQFANTLMYTDVPTFLHGINKKLATMEARHSSLRICGHIYDKYFGPIMYSSP